MTLKELIEKYSEVIKMQERDIRDMAKDDFQVFGAICVKNCLDLVIKDLKKLERAKS